jgi:hypothetical protein
MGIWEKRLSLVDRVRGGCQAAGNRGKAAILLVTRHIFLLGDFR